MNKEQHIIFLARQVELAQMELDEKKAVLDTTKAQLIDAVGVKDEGSKTLTSGAYKITTTQNFSRKLDQDILLNEVNQEFARCRIAPPVKLEYKLNVKEFKALEKANPELYKVAQKAVTTSPLKPSIKIQRVEQC